MKLHSIDFAFIGVTVRWRFIDDYAPSYLIDVVRPGKTITFKTAKAPTLNNARKFAEE